MRFKTIYLQFALLFTLLASLGVGRSQAQMAHLYGVSPFQDSMWAIDTTSWTVVSRLAPSLSGFTITGMTGLAYDPCGHQTYIIMKVSGVTGRVLGTIDLNTGVCTQVGNLGANFSTINFREDGQLFGVTGDGATPSETMFLIDKATGTTTLAAALGAGADGEIISYNWDDDFFYHWSGNGTVVMEKVMSTSPYTATNIPISGTPGGETFGSIYLGGGKFINSNISSTLIRLNSSGLYGTTASSGLPDDWRGLVMPPNWSMPDDTVCVNDTVQWDAFAGITYQDTVVYIWGDGDSSSVFPVGGGSHAYSSAGSYMSYVVLKNPCGRDTLDSEDITVFALPGVSLTPASPAYLCDSFLTLTGSSGGTSQWYMNGMAIGGATTPSYDATSVGWYNMTKTNLNGCTDSAAVGINLINPPTSVDLLSPADSTSFCEGTVVTLMATPGATNYEWWLDGSPVDTTSVDTFDVGTAGTWDVVAWYGNCPVASTGGVTLIEDPLPVAAFSYADLGDGSADFTDLSTDATSWFWDAGASGTSTLPNPNFLFGLSGFYTVTLIVSNACGSDTLVDSLVSIFVSMENPALSGFSLTNQPNPFSDKTTFVVNAATAGEASLILYNVHGQAIRTLHEGSLTAGQHQFDWDGRSSNGRQVAAGTYQAVLRTANGQVSRQVLLAK